jgi:glycosyltransferase involved in cell wall biosynthesis
MKVSVIVPTYKDIPALRLILLALEKQTYKDFEVIVAEDDDSNEVKEFLKNFDTILTIKHFFHEDSGNRKAIIMNKVLPHTRGEYLVFIDGDVIPFTTFVESHVTLSEKKTVLCGRRVNLGDKVTKDLRENKITSFDIEKHYFRLYKYLKNDNIRHYEQGLRLTPSSFIYKFISQYNKNIHILGSNFSCYRSDLFEINGFDEDITGTSKDDVDLE